MPTQTKKLPTCLEDIFNDDEFGLLNMDDDVEGLFVSADHYKSSTRNGYVAGDGELITRQMACADFHLYKQALIDATLLIKSTKFTKGTSLASTIAVGDVFVFDGLVAVIVAINESEKRNSGQKYRAHVVYANGTESKLLFSSVVAKTHKPNNYLVKPV